MRYFEPKYFIPQEYVPPEVFDELGDQSLLLIDYRLLKTDDAIREFFGKKVTINNWHKKGSRVHSGFRPANCTVGAKWSQHKFGRASDKLIEGISSSEARKAIITNEKNFPYITIIENNVSWLHTDCRCTIGGGIQLI